MRPMFSRLACFVRCARSSRSTLGRRVVFGFCVVVLAFSGNPTAPAQTYVPAISPRTQTQTEAAAETDSVPVKSPSELRTEMLERRKDEAVRKQREKQRQEFEAAFRTRLSEQLSKMLQSRTVSEEDGATASSPVSVRQTLQTADDRSDRDNRPDDAEFAHSQDSDRFVPLVETPPEPPWNRLFDTKTMMGWRIQDQGPYGGGRFTIEDGAICSDPAHPGLIHTTGQFSDVFLEFQMQAEPGACAFVLLRTSPSPKNLATSCLAIVLCSPEPTIRTPGSFVGRKRSRLILSDDEPTIETDTRPWHKYEIKAIGDEIEVSGDHFYPNMIWDTPSVQRGYIGFLVTRGRVRFRNILWTYARPVRLIDERELSADWNTDANDSTFSPAIVETNLRLLGGPGMLESQATFGNFIFNTEFRILDRRSVAGVGFRCLPGRYGSGYDCRIAYWGLEGTHDSGETDYGTGSLFPLRKARKLRDEKHRWGNLTIKAVDNHIQTWVDGIQTLDYFDRRSTVAADNTSERATEEPDAGDGPRRTGTLQVYGTSPATSVEFREMFLSEVRDRWP